MGSCQPGQATTHHPDRFINEQGSSPAVKNRSASSDLTQSASFWGKAAMVQAPFNAQPGQGFMAPHKHSVRPNNTQMPEPIQKVAEHITAEVQVTVYRMSGGRRGSSRSRGGSRGRPATQRLAASPDSSVNISHILGRSSRQPIRDPLDCGHSEHPAIRYRMPCTLENNTLIVSITVEQCSDSRGTREGQTTPSLDVEVPRVDFRPPPQTGEAGTSTMQPAQEGTQPVQAEDRKDHQSAKEDEPYETDDD